MATNFVITFSLDKSFYNLDLDIAVVACVLDRFVPTRYFDLKNNLQLIIFYVGN